MEKQTFSRREVERSFRKFNDTVDDLQLAPHNTWSDTFDRLLAHCENDPVMQIVTGPLKENRQVNAKDWIEQSLATDCGTVGSGRYKLPYDDDERTSLLYQFFLLLIEGEHDFSGFCFSMFGGESFQDATDSFTQELVVKFTREVSYRLDEILEDLGDSSEVPREAMFVFHHHDNSTTVHGNIQGSILATGNSSVSGSSAVYSSEEAVIAAIEGMRSLIESIPGIDGAFEDLDKLVSAAREKNQNEIKSYAKNLCERSPAIRNRLTEIGTNIATSLAGSTIFEGLSFLLS